MKDTEDHSENFLVHRVIIKKSEPVDLWTESLGDPNNPAILLIAGAHAPSVFWPDFFCKKLVDAGYFIIRYDNRDIGYSTHFPSVKNSIKPPYNLSDLAYDALSILDDYEINRANIIGHSMGGNIVQYIAAFHADRILRAISISVAVAGTTTAKHCEYDAVMQELLKNIPTGDFAQDWVSGWKKSLQLLHGSTYEFDEEMAKSYTQTIYERHQGDFNPAWNHIAAQQNLPALIDKLLRDMLFINGSDDVMSPAENIRKLPNKFKTKILDGAGHLFFNKELWQLLADIILEYLYTNKKRVKVKL